MEKIQSLQQVVLGTWDRQLPVKEQNYIIFSKSVEK